MVVSLAAEQGLYATWASVVVAPGLQSTGPIVVANGISCSAAAEQDMESSWIRDRTCVFCIDRWIFFPPTTETPGKPLFWFLTLYI